MLNFRVKNKIIISSLALAFFVSPATFAVSYYAGISGGNQYLMNDSSVDILPGSYYPDGSFVTDEIKTGDSGGVGEFYFGISSMPYKSMYIGLEANITGFSASSNSEVGYQADDNPVLLISSDSSVKYAAGLSIMPGYVFSDSQTMVYARMGIEYIRFSNTLAPSNNEYDPGTSFVDPADGFTADSIAYRAGLGIEHYVSPSLSLRVEGDFWHVNKIDNSILYVSIANDPAYDVERVSTFGINMITATVGLTYHFGG
jgi:opacity protein-like surface antigen